MEIVPVLYHRDDEAWWADSDAVPGWTATAETLDELRPLVEEGVRFALERDDVLVRAELEPGAPVVADIVFDFVSGQTISVKRSFADALRGVPGSASHTTAV